jgi:dihydroxy-acid dehydratase
MEDFFYAGGCPRCCATSATCSTPRASRSNGARWGERRRGQVFNDDVIRTRDDPLVASDTLAVLHGNLARTAR